MKSEQYKKVSIELLSQKEKYKELARENQKKIEEMEKTINELSKINNKKEEDIKKEIEK